MKSIIVAFMFTASLFAGLLSDSTSQKRAEKAVWYAKQYPQITRTLKGEGEKEAYLFIDPRCPSCREMMQTGIPRLLKDAKEVHIVFNPLYRKDEHKAGIIDALYILYTTSPDADNAAVLDAYRYVEKNRNTMIVDRVAEGVSRDKALSTLFVRYLKEYSLDRVPVVYGPDGAPFYANTETAR